MIDVGLIGFGLAGRAFHAQVIRATPGLRLAAILQRHGNEAAEKYPDVRVVRSVEELLDIRDIRLVVIATPNETHAPIARQCLEAGRDVVVDKPFATTLKEAAELVELGAKMRPIDYCLSKPAIRRRFSSHTPDCCRRHLGANCSLRNKL